LSRSVTDLAAAWDDQQELAVVASSNQRVPK
jgi:hypothetical protein